MTVPTHAELLREYLEQLSLPDAEARLPRWADWLKLRLGASMALGAVLTLAGCGGEESANNSNQGGQTGTLSAVGGASQGGTIATGGNKYGILLGGSGGTSQSTTSNASGAGGAGAAPTMGGSDVDLYGIFMSGGTTPVGNGGSGAATTAGGTGGGTYGTGGVKYGMYMSGGTKAVGNGGSGAATTTGGNPSSMVADYGVFMMGTGGTKPAGNGGSSAAGPGS